MKIVGIAGLPRSGKDTVAELFITDGWFGISFGDVVREHAMQRHKSEPDPISIANMTETSNWLRETHGPDVILQIALKNYREREMAGKADKGLVLWSVRAPVEADFILQHGGRLIWVETSDEVRHQRAMQNLREGEQPISLEEFQRQEALQWTPQPGIPEEVQMNIAYIKQKATDVLENNGSDRDTFLQQVKTFISSMS